MRFVYKEVRPDQLIKGDCVVNPTDRQYDVVYDAYWSEEHQRYFVYLGCLQPECGTMLIIDPRVNNKITVRKTIKD